MEKKEESLFFFEKEEDVILSPEEREKQTKKNAISTGLSSYSNYELYKEKYLKTKIMSKKTIKKKK